MLGAGAFVEETSGEKVEKVKAPQALLGGGQGRAELGACMCCHNARPFLISSLCTPPCRYFFFIFHANADESSPS